MTGSAGGGAAETLGVARADSGSRRPGGTVGQPSDRPAVTALEAPLRVGSLCTGYGGLDLAVAAVLGGRPLWCADNDRHVAQILDARLAGVPNLGDITTADWASVPEVDVITAGFPCQDISYAGRGAGITRETRSGVWFAVADAVRLLRPDRVVLENVPALRSRGLGLVLGDLAALGYDTAWTCLRASDVGAPHRRERIFIYAHRPGGAWSDRCGAAADPGRAQSQRRRDPAVVAGSPTTAVPETVDAPGCRDQAAAHPPRERHRHDRPPSGAGIQSPVVGGAAAHAQGIGWDQGLGPAHRLQGLPDPARNRDTDWGVYEQAVHRWEAVLGRPAPSPVEPGTRQQPRLSARFVEWMMGLPDGWVTAVDLPRTAHMRALGNGVVPQQAVAALHQLVTFAPGAFDRAEHVADREWQAAR